MSSDHKERVRQEFTQQAQAYAANPSITNAERLARLIEAVRPHTGARVLDVACGPGYVGLAFAQVGCEVVGIDLTAAPLAIAEQKSRELGLSNVRFQIEDAENLPFAEQEFDIVVSRFALHHCEDVQRVLAEMTRVCREQGSVVVEDLVTSEYPAHAAYQNHFEQLRDPSHTHALSISEFLGLFTTCGLEVEQVYTDALVPSLETWLANAHTPSEQAREVRELVAQDELHDHSGTRPFRQNGELYFHQRTATIIGRKLLA